MELLINKIMDLGGNRKLLKAKVFGGSHIIPCISRANNMGRINARFVLKFLDLEGIPVLSQDLGGQEARRIYFRTDTGEVLLKRILKKYSVGARELITHKRLRSKVEETGDITLFT
jgi:chemotaxis protein CheD